MSSHMGPGVTQLCPAQQESQVGPVSVMNALTAFLTEEQSSHFWGRSSAELSAFGRKEGGEPTELAFLVWRGRGGRSRAPADPAVPVLPCSPGISFHRVLGPNFPSYGLCQMCFT